MTRRLVICVVVALGLGTMRATADLLPVPPDPGINDAAQAALDTTPYADEINQKISDEINKLVKNSDDKPTVSMIRTWLISQDPPTASNPYQEAYTNSLNNNFLSALAQGDPPITARLNMALVIKDLTGQKAALTPTLVKLLGDKSSAVVFVAEQSARAMLPLALQNANFNAGPRDTLLAAIVKSVTDNNDGPLAGMIAEEAYRAINPKLWTAGAIPSGSALSALIDANLNLQKARLDIYKVGIPADPNADSYASYLLLTPDGWNAMGVPQQLQAVQNAVDMISWAGQRVANMPANLSRDLIIALNSEGTWIGKDGLGGIIQDQTLDGLGLAIKNLSPAANPGAIKQACDGVFGYLQSIPNFNTLQAPQNLGAPTTVPAAEAAQ
jgi:hypothetical protein